MVWNFDSVNFFIGMFGVLRGGGGGGFLCKKDLCVYYCVYGLKSGLGIF